MHSDKWNTLFHSHVVDSTNRNSDRQDPVACTAIISSISVVHVSLHNITNNIYIDQEGARLELSEPGDLKIA
jgi:hypothetical protein